MNESFALDRLPVGQNAYVALVEHEPSMKKRLTDLGLIRGTRVACLFRSPFGDPSAYMIRGAVIALRRQDASRIRVVSGPSPA